MKTNRVVANTIAALLLGAAGACAMAPLGDGHGAGYVDQGSSAQPNNLRDAGRWHDAGDHIDRERSSLDWQPLRLAKTDMLWYAVYVPQHERKVRHRVWA